MTDRDLDSESSVESTKDRDENNHNQGCGGAEVQGLDESEAAEKQPSTGDMMEGQRVAEREETNGETGAEPVVEVSGTGLKDTPQATSGDGREASEEEGKDEDRTAEVVDGGPPREESDGERETKEERDDCKKSQQGKNGAVDQRERRENKEEQSAMEEMKGGEEPGKEADSSSDKGANLKRTQANDREGDGKEKDKGKRQESEKQGKMKRKSGVNPSPSTPSRPRSTARSIRASARNDIIAKFQQGAPETAVKRNFKVQRSTMGAATELSIKQKVLQWCRNKTRNYEGINIENFSSSWCDGLAFCALIHRFYPDAFDYSSLKQEERKKNFTLAFSTAESLADCCPLLEVNDMILMGDRPDPMCVFTYVQSLCQNLSKIEKARKDKEKDEQDKHTNESEILGENDAKKDEQTVEKQDEDSESVEIRDSPGSDKEEENVETTEKEADAPTPPAFELNEDNNQKGGDE